MRAFGDFLKTTIVGGFLFVVPLVAIVVFAREALKISADAVRPVARWIPVEEVAGILIVDIVALAAVVGLSFLTGLFIGTRVGRAVGGRLEQSVLFRMPGYALFKSATRGIAGLEAGSELSAALARFDDAWVLAFVVERHADGLCTVFVPNAPTPTSGSIFFMTEDRIRPLDVPVLAAMSCYMRLGVGSRALLEKASRPRGRSGEHDEPGAKPAGAAPIAGES